MLDVVRPLTIYTTRLVDWGAAMHACDERGGKTDRWTPTTRKSHESINSRGMKFKFYRGSATLLKKSIL